MTALQRYVRTADLDRVFDAVEEAVNGVDMSTLFFTANGTAHLEDPALPGIGLLVIAATPGREGHVPSVGVGAGRTGPC